MKIRKELLEKFGPLPWGDPDWEDEGGAYLRLSDLPTEYEAESTIRQCEVELGWARSHRVRITRVYEDLDKSAFKRNVVREDFDRAIDDLRKRKIKYLISAKVDRFSRRGMGQVGTILDELEDVGGVLVFVADGILSNQTFGRTALALLSEQARAESKNTQWRVGIWHESNRKKGRWTAERPFGYVKQADGMLKRHPEEWLIRRQVLEDALAGKTLREIAIGFNEQGVESPEMWKYRERLAAGKAAKKPGATTWSTSTVSYLLHSPTMAGLYSHGRQPVRGEDGEYIMVVADEGEAIATFAEWERAKAIINKRVKHRQTGRRRGQRTGAGRPSSFLLVGLSFCPEDGRLVGVNRTVGGKEYFYYRCWRGTSGHECTRVSVSMRKLNEHVVATALEATAAALSIAHDELGPGNHVENSIAEVWIEETLPDHSAERANVRQQLAEVEALIKDLEEARYLRREFSDPEGLKRYELLRSRQLEQKQRLTEKLAELPDHLPDLSFLLDPTQSRQVFNLESLDRKRSILRLAIEKVVVHPGDQTAPIEDRVEITYRPEIAEMLKRINKIAS
ncbi:recombinase family protein [Longimycelium tulufanense]|nr:recombinase family protein [Longimycelium tulufanense]